MYPGDEEAARFKESLLPTGQKCLLSSFSKLMWIFSDILTFFIGERKNNNPVVEQQQQKRLVSQQLKMHQFSSWKAFWCWLTSGLNKGHHICLGDPDWGNSTPAQTHLKWATEASEGVIEVAHTWRKKSRGAAEINNPEPEFALSESSKMQLLHNHREQPSQPCVLGAPPAIWWLWFCVSRSFFVVT